MTVKKRNNKKNKINKIKNPLHPHIKNTDRCLNLEAPESNSLPMGEGWGGVKTPKTMKTKHIIFIFAGLFWLTLQFTQAQDYTVYKFQNRANGQYLSVGQTSNGSPSITLTEKTLENNLNQHFILTRQGSGIVLIASAQNPSMFLKNDGTFEELSDGDSTTDFEWKVKLAANLANEDNTGDPYGILVAVNKASMPVLGTSDSAVQFYDSPTDIYNDSSERVCFRIVKATEMF